MYKYFVVVETEKYGYILETFIAYDKAFEYYTTCEHYMNYTSGAIDRALTKPKRYKLNNNSFVSHFIHSGSSGDVTIYLFEIGPYWRSIEHFIADREYIPVFPKDTELRN